MLLDHNKFMVKSEGTFIFSTKKYEVFDGFSDRLLGTGNVTTGFRSWLRGLRTVEVRDAADNEVLFRVMGWGGSLADSQILDPKGQVIGQFKFKALSLSGGFHVYDKDSKHIAEIRGIWGKNGYTFVTPDRSAQMGTVETLWGLPDKLVEIDPKYANDIAMKILIVGITFGIENLDDFDG